MFVDGCKSWYGTRYFLERIADRFPVGGHLVMQDYGWFTCFWLPAIIGLLPEHFRLVAHTQDTYGFELLKPLTPDLVRDVYPEHPADLGRAAIDDLFGRLLDETGRRGEVRGAMVLGIQHAAAIAYIGDKDEAKQQIAGSPRPARVRGLPHALPRAGAQEPDLHAGGRASPRLAARRRCRRSGAPGKPTS